MITSTKSDIPPSARAIKTDAYNWILSEAAIGGNVFARYAHAWLRSDRTQAINPMAKSWLEGHRDGSITLKAQWAAVILDEVNGVGRYCEVGA